MAHKGVKKRVCGIINGRILELPQVATTPGAR